MLPFAGIVPGESRLGCIRRAWALRRLGMPFRTFLRWAWWILRHGPPRPVDLGPPAWLSGVGGRARIVLLIDGRHPAGVFYRSCLLCGALEESTRPDRWSHHDCPERRERGLSSVRDLARRDVK